MNTDAEMKNRKAVLSTLWIFVVCNYLFADVYALFFNPVLQTKATQELLSGHIGSIQITQGFVLLTAILLETAMVMIVLSRVLPYPANRLSNIIVGVFQTAFAATGLVGDTFPNLFSVFFIVIEVACTAFIVWYAWTWSRPEGAELKRAGSGFLPSVQSETMRQDGIDSAGVQAADRTSGAKPTR